MSFWPVSYTHLDVYKRQVLLLGVKILKKAEVSRRAMLSVTAFLAFCPAFYLTGGSVAPDALTAFFIVFAFYYTLLWEENHSWKNTLLLAAGYGMGMITKISCGTIALLTAAVFIHTLWRETEKPGQLIRKYLVFAGISAPMGLWYSCLLYTSFRTGIILQKKYSVPANAIC